MASQIEQLSMLKEKRSKQFEGCTDGLRPPSHHGVSIHSAQEASETSIDSTKSRVFEELHEISPIFKSFSDMVKYAEMYRSCRLQSCAQSTPSKPWQQENIEKPVKDLISHYNDLSKHPSPAAQWYVRKGATEVYPRCLTDLEITTKKQSRTYKKLQNHETLRKIAMEKFEMEFQRRSEQLRMYLMNAPLERPQILEALIRDYQQRSLLGFTATRASSETLNPTSEFTARVHSSANQPENSSSSKSDSPDNEKSDEVTPVQLFSNSNLEQLQSRANTALTDTINIVEALQDPRVVVVKPYEKRVMKSKTLLESDVMELEAKKDDTAPLSSLPHAMENSFSDFTEETFLSSAIGDEMRERGAEEESSLKTDDKSCLISKFTKKVANRFRSSHLTNISPYSRATIASSDDSLLSVMMEPIQYGYASYEEIKNWGPEMFTTKGQKELKKHLHIIEQIMRQTEKMLKYGRRKKRQFIGSFQHFEGERLLIVSKIRKDTLLSQVYKMPQPLIEATARITIKKLRCLVNPVQPSNPVDRYYLCILQHRITVFSTHIVRADRVGNVVFGGCYIFEGMDSLFNIRISLYSLSIKKPTQSCNFKRLFKLKSCPKVPMLKLIGSSYIGLFNAKERTFPVLKDSCAKLRQEHHQFIATVKAELNWPEPLSGFLALGRSHGDRPPTWNRRWCVLKNAELRYYSCPPDEIFCSPIRSYDIKCCTSVEHSSEVKYLKQKAIMLTLQEMGETKRIFICGDLDQENQVWFEHITKILAVKNEWLPLNSRRNS